jgi:electron transfer flavoprotein alpha subunit
LSEIYVSKEKCSGCGDCIKVCPFNAIVLADNVAMIQDNCQLCRICLSSCSQDAISVKKTVTEADLSDYKGVLVFGEQRKGIISPIVYELLGKGLELANHLGEMLECVVLGWNMKKQAEELTQYGVDKVFLYNSPVLEYFRDDPYSRLTIDLVKDVKPSIFLLGATSIGRSIAPRVSTALRTGLTADCTELSIDSEGQLLQTRPAYGGNIMATILCRRNRPQMATVRHKVMKKAEKIAGSKGEVFERDFDETALLDRTHITTTTENHADEEPISEAEIIVSGGKGLGNPEGFKLIRELANVLGGSVGASRATVDEGWIDYTHQIGLSGKTVRPRLYIACGISGAIQHLAGMQSSDTIVAINKDPDAPILKIADYGIVGDVYQVIPEIIRVVKELKREN